MKEQTVKNMLTCARKNGVAEIVYTGTSSGGLYSSSSARVYVFLTRYPDLGEREAKDFADCLESVGKKPEDFLDTVDVMEGYVKVTINHLENPRSENQRADDLDCTFSTYGGHAAHRHYRRGCVSRNTYGYTGYTEHNGEELHTIMIPFENIVAIVC